MGTYRVEALLGTQRTKGPRVTAVLRMGTYRIEALLSMPRSAQILVITSILLKRGTIPEKCHAPDPVTS